MKKYRIDEITENLDNLRKPLNNIERSKISKHKLYPYYGANNIMDYVDQYIFDEEIICIAEDGGAWGFNEKCSYIVNEKCWVNNHAHVLRAKENLNIQYLSYYLNYSDLNSKITGTTRGKLTKSALNSIEVLLPSLEKQEMIVEVLNKSQELIDKRKVQIEALDELVKSRFIEMFGDPVSNPMDWKKKRLVDECNIITGNTPSRKVEEYYGEYIEWIKSDNITDARIYLTKAKEYLSKEGLKVGRSINENSILMTCIAGSIKCIGNVAISNRKVAFNQQINGIEPLKNNVYFMYQQFNLSQKYIQSTINMSLKGILSKGQLSELEFIFPPIEKQNEFAEFFKQTDKLKFEMQESLRKLEDNFNSLMQRAFKGELFN
ncbi:restriction endonuclease subunit S [Clostridium butyricum]|uniref:restriction endonuclease subunit S n=1 Tax=Clostridium butyricum TaxID=1492 RepID=UPI0011DCF54A|nr:restriction endonuclease subunit S [Clostridium butyricum]